MQRIALFEHGLSYYIIELNSLQKPLRKKSCAASSALCAKQPAARGWTTSAAHKLAKMRTRSSREPQTNAPHAPSRARLALATIVLAALVAVVPLGANTIENGCTMTRMWPYYEDAKINHGRYGVLRYRERGRDPYEAKSGAILFLPGNAGDARQVRFGPRGRPPKRRGGLRLRF